ncbi:actin-related protein 2/3 complex subunit 5-B [Plodia interpunctella]|uniref:actin-related protein 2/3 complex subunit 5-B n=1 Tax=Plodia interpunctella TaxID=58824 RepID=UPI002367CA7E|nr:actin-related protein 2/3 complex subunit 5-B [Plodia interpunctella]
MAKNTFNSAFRKIDIDQYNEDNFKDEEAEHAVPSGPDESEVSALLNQGRYNEALQIVLSNAPLGSANQQIKDNALALTLKVLLAIKSGQIEDAVSSLTPNDVDILMKYIYRGFECPSEGSSGHLLLWHEKAFNVGGSGSIVRVLSDRMKV